MSEYLDSPVLILTARYKVACSEFLEAHPDISREDYEALCDRAHVDLTEKLDAIKADPQARYFACVFLAPADDIDVLSIAGRPLAGE